MARLRIEAQLDSHTSLMRAVADRTARVAVIGLGYVGLPMAMGQVQAGYRVYGIDNDPARVRQIRQATACPMSGNGVATAISEGRLQVTGDTSLLEGADVVVVCVPTPLARDLTPDLTALEDAVGAVARHLRPGQLVSIESTVYPGATEEVILPMLGSTGLSVEEDFFLVHSPERIDPGNPRWNVTNTARLIGAVGPLSLEAALAFYGQTVHELVPTPDTRTAEMAKLFENTFRAVNIGLVNEMAVMCDALGLEVWEVLDAAFTKPFGIMPFYPGPGVGGHCIPVDPHYLGWKAEQSGASARFVSLAGEANRRMPRFVCDRAWRLLAEYGLTPARARVLVVGITYKPDVPDCRQSPAVDIIRLLRAEGATVSYHDPLISRYTGEGLDLTSVALTERVVSGHDLVIIVTDHTCVDYSWLASASRRVLDTRNATRDVKRWRERITLL